MRLRCANSTIDRRISGHIPLNSLTSHPLTTCFVRLRLQRSLSSIGHHLQVFMKLCSPRENLQKFHQDCNSISRRRILSAVRTARPDRRSSCRSLVSRRRHHRLHRIQLELTEIPHYRQDIQEHLSRFLSKLTAWSARTHPRTRLVEYRRERGKRR